MEVEQLVHTYSDPLYRIAYCYVKDQQAAEEIVQDVFLKFYRTQAQFEGRSQLKTYLTRMVINKSYDYLRSWKHKKQLILEGIFTKSASAEHVVLKQDETSYILQAVLELPIKYRETILLYYYEELQIKEISVMLQISESTIKSRLQRARALLKQVLQNEAWEVLKDERFV